MGRQLIHFECLLNRRVRAMNGRFIGRIEEARAELRDGKWRIIEFLVGDYGLFERLAAWSIGRAILRGLHSRPRRRGHRIPWQQLDLSDWRRPRLRCKLEELPPDEQPRN